MMLHQAPVYFGDIEQMLAKALYEAGKSDTEIGLEIGVSVNNIIHWRREAGLPDHASPARGPEATSNAPVIRAGASVPPAPPPGPPPAFVPAVVPVPQMPPMRLVGEDSRAKPEGANALEIGMNMDRPVCVDLAELLATRLLIQGNSGSGKSHLLRKLAETSANVVQQVIIDPEGDFVTLADAFGHTVVEASTQANKLPAIAEMVRKSRTSIVLNLEGVDQERQMDCVGALLNGLFDAPREHWHPALVLIDEAHLFAPASAGEEDKDTRKAVQGAMMNLMCRGRKRGLAGVLATQRLAKLHKNVAAEASNFLMGRTFLDIDIARAADLLGMAKSQTEQIRNLDRGQFLALGPAITRRPLPVKVGATVTTGRATVETLVPLPTGPCAELDSLLAPELPEQVEAIVGHLRVVK